VRFKILQCQFISFKCKIISNKCDVLTTVLFISQCDVVSQFFDLTLILKNTQKILAIANLFVYHNATFHSCDYFLRLRLYISQCGLISSNVNSYPTNAILYLTNAMFIQLHFNSQCDFISHDCDLYPVYLTN